MISLVARNDDPPDEPEPALRSLLLRSSGVHLPSLPPLWRAGQPLLLLERTERLPHPHQPGASLGTHPLPLHTLRRSCHQRGAIRQLA